MVKEYTHEPLTDFTKVDNRQAFEEALQRVNLELGIEYPLLINGERTLTDEKIISYNPAIKTEIIGKVSKANKVLAEQAMQAALVAFESWKNWQPESRAQLLLNVSSILKRRMHEFSAYLVKEVGKPWIEADADTAEAIDFIEYYARQMMSLKEEAKVQSREGEVNQYQYLSLGVGVIISPFNFPLAIMAGTTVAAIAAGNTVLLKPSNNAPVIAAKFVEVMQEAGLPKGVLNYIPGNSAEIGDFLVDSSKNTICFFYGIA